MQNPSAIQRDAIETWHNAGHINYLGFTDKVEEEIADVHCMVLPSFYREGVPRSLLEGAAMGRPIITTDNVGCKETVEHGINGYICEARVQKSLENAMACMVNLSEIDREKMSLASRKLVENKFNEKTVVKAYSHAIENAIPPSQSQRSKVEEITAALVPLQCTIKGSMRGNGPHFYHHLSVSWHRSKLLHDPSTIGVGSTHARGRNK